MTGPGFEDRTLTDNEWKQLTDRWLAEHPPGKRVLLIPPDITRCYSYAGVIAVYLYQRLHKEHQIFLMPAVGTHMQMTRQEKESFFPGIPEEAFLEHDWRRDNAVLGIVPKQVVQEATKGLYQQEIQIEVDRRLVSGEFDTMISIGQVVPHEVVGMANYTKNLIVGLGGRDMINHSHMISAVCGIEHIMGNVDSPVRAVFDYVQEHFLDRLQIAFFLTVTCERQSKAELYGLFIGTGRDTFTKAAALAAKKNITWLPRRPEKVVCYLEPEEFRSTWVGNKAIYRTRMAIADGGELLILAPGLRQFGENEEVDQVIRRYGYSGTEHILELYREHRFDQLNMVAAHLIHGSSDGRFRIIYATDPELISREEVEQVGFLWMDVRKAMDCYRPEEKEEGWYLQPENGEEEYYFIKAPAVGLWRIR